MTEEVLAEAEVDERESWSLDQIHARTVELRRLQLLLRGDPCEGDELPEPEMPHRGHYTNQHRRRYTHVYANWLHRRGSQ